MKPYGDINIPGFLKMVADFEDNENRTIKLLSARKDWMHIQFTAKPGSDIHLNEPYLSVLNGFDVFFDQMTGGGVISLSYPRSSRTFVFIGHYSIPGLNAILLTQIMGHSIL